MFFDLAAAAGSTDFGSDTEVKTLLDKFNSTADLYLQHNQHESEFILPHMKPIVRLTPPCAASLRLEFFPCCFSRRPETRPVCFLFLLSWKKRVSPFRVK
jgi:hypothetical protein